LGRYLAALFILLAAAVAEPIWVLVVVLHPVQEVLAAAGLAALSTGLVIAPRQIQVAVLAALIMDGPEVLELLVLEVLAALLFLIHLDID
jgi:hypothetical protein